MDGADLWPSFARTVSTILFALFRILPTPSTGLCSIARTLPYASIATQLIHASIAHKPTTTYWFYAASARCSETSFVRSLPSAYGRIHHNRP